jgi:hypothetical protein
MLEMVEEFNPRHPSEPKRKVLVPAAKYRNPTNVPVKMRFWREGPTLAARAPAGWDPTKDGSRPHHPARILDVLVPPGGECIIPEECAAEVHILECAICTIDKLRCRKPEHKSARVIAGGAGPSLIRVYEDGEEDSTPVHPSLTAQAEPPRMDPADLNSLHERTLRRLAAQAGAK